ncbi:MAG TPA: sugar MFS transporter [Terracidiphilus sp.]|nr:sugar MFS transporter [Terracidiphilus sp.]
MSTRSTPPAGQGSPSYTGPFIIVTALFFIFGFITNLNMALVPHLRNIFTLPYAWAMLAESAFFLAYFVFSSPTAKLIESIGYKKTMVVSLFIQVVGCLMFVPAAKYVSFPLFLTAVFIVGAGVTALQTAANPYVAILGPESSAPVRLTLAQALNSLGGSIAPLIAGHYILTDPAKMASKAAVANTVRGPYIAIAAGLLILGMAVAFLHLPHVKQTQEFRPATEGDPILSRSIWGYRHTVLGALGIFLYVGVEVGLASIAVNYFLTQGVNDGMGSRVAHYFSTLGGFGDLVTRVFGPWNGVGIAAILVSLYWFGALIGRLLGSWVLTKIKSNRLLGAFGIIAASLLGVAMVSSGLVAIWTVVLCGFFNSIMFPNIFALAIKGLGPMTSKGSGLIMTAVVGGAVIPPLIGATADHVGIQHAFFIPMFCYLYIAFYGLWGSKPQHMLPKQALTD